MLCRSCKQEQSKTLSRSKLKVRSNVRQFKDQSFEVWRCTRCDSINSVGPEDLTKYYRQYPFKNTPLDRSYRIAYDRRISLLNKYDIGTESSLLDFGCAEGAFISYLKSKSFENCYGYDKFSQDYGDLEKAQSVTYDSIVSYDVIEHLDDPEELFIFAQKSLKEYGVLVVGTPNASEIDLDQPEKYLLELHQPYHRILLSQSSVVSMAESYGFELEYIDERFYMDSPHPFVNYRFISSYVQKTGGFVDVAVEAPHFKTVITNPILWFWAFLGYLFPLRTNMTLVFRLRREVECQSRVG